VSIEFTFDLIAYSKVELTEIYLATWNG